MTSNVPQQPDHDLERLLHALGDRLDLPQMGDSVSAARARIEARSLANSDARSSQVFIPDPDEDDAHVVGPVLIEDGVVEPDRPRSRVRELALLSAGIAAAAIVAVGLAIVFGGWPGADDEADGPAMADIPGVEPFEIPGYEFVRTVGGPTVPNDPSDIAVGEDGRIYVADYGINRIVAFTRDGEIDTSWGQSGFSEEIDQVQRLAIADDGTLWAVDRQGNVYRSTDESDITQAWSVSDGGGVTGLAVGNQDQVFLLVERENKVLVFDANGTLMNEWWLGNDQPIDMTIDDQGRLYIVYTRLETNESPGTRGVRVYDTAGNELADWNADTGLPVSREGVLGGIEAGPDGNLYLVHDPRTSEDSIELLRLTQDGDVAASWSVDTRVDGLFAEPSIGVAADGRVLLADADDQRIVAVDQDGTVSTVIQADLPGRFTMLWGVDVQSDGNIYAIDPFRREVFKFGPDGALLQQFAIDNDLQTDQLSGLSSLKVDDEGTMYVAAPEQHAILVFGPDGSMIRTIGRLNEYDPANDALLFEPYGFDLAANGDVLVADRQSAGYIKRYSAQGEYLGRWLVSDDNSLAAQFQVAGNEVYVNRDDQAFQVYGLDGNLLREISISGLNDGETDRSLMMLAIADDGTMYAESVSIELPREDGQGFIELLTINPQGVVTSATTLEGPPGPLALHAINVGSDGRLYLSDLTYGKHILVYAPK